MSNQEPSQPSDFGAVPPPPAPAPRGGQAPPLPAPGNNPPPPGAYGQAPPPPPAYGQAPHPPAYAQAPPAYAGAPGPTTAKPPRPDVKLGAVLTILGSLISIVGVFLPWASGQGTSYNGMATFIDDTFTAFESPGVVSLVLAAVTIGFGIALFFAGRVLAVAILAIVFASITVFWGLGVIGITSDAVAVGDSLFDANDASGDPGFGAILQPIAPLITLAGAIVATSKRRRF
jgi:hypothetical protein